jgi:hypothetical protein
MAEKKTGFIGFVSLPLLLSILTLLLFWQWPGHVENGFQRMMAFVTALQRPAEETENLLARQGQQRPRIQVPQSTPAGISIPRSQTSGVSSPTARHARPAANDMAANAEQQARRAFCRQFQQDYLNNPDEANKSAMEAACIGVSDDQLRD